MPELRGQRRVAYHTKIRLRSADREQSVVARVQNLSASGVFVTAPELPVAGTEVDCRLLLDGQKCTLKGRVAWMRPPVDQIDGVGACGAGINFVAVDPREAELLARAVDPAASADRMVVDVWFEGLRSPIRSHATIASDGLSISTRLPFLRLNSPVRVSFVRRGVEEQHGGIVEGVVLAPSAEDGIPRLQVTVSTGLPTAVQGTIVVAKAQSALSSTSSQIASLAGDQGSLPGVYVDHGTTASAESRLVAPIFAGTSSPVPEAVPDGSSTPTLPLPAQMAPPVRPAPRNETVSPPVTAARPPDHDRTPISRPTPELTAPPVSVAKAAEPTRARILWTIGVGVLFVAGAGALVYRQADGPAARRSRAPEATRPAPAATNTVREGTPQAKGEQASGRAAAPAAMALAPADPPADISSGGDALKVVDHSGASTLIIPMNGSSKGVQHFLMAQPAGVAVNVPNGRPRAGMGNHSTGHGAFKRVVVTRRGGAGSQIRIYLLPSLGAAVSADSDGLRITVRPKRNGRRS